MRETLPITKEMDTRRVADRRIALALGGEAGSTSSESLFRALAGHTPVGIFVSNAAGECVYVNARWCELAGMGPDEAMGDGWAAALHPDDADRVLSEWARAAAAGEDSIVEYRFRRPDGAVSWIQGFASALRGGDGGVTGWVGTCLDLTARRDAEEALRQERDRFRVAFDDAPIGMALVELDGTFVRVNRGLCEMVGYETAELIGRRFHDITHPDDLHRDVEHAEKMLANEIRAYQMEKRYLRRDGSAIWVSLSVSLVRDPAGKPLYFLAQMEDISARKEVERELQLLADHDALTGLLNRRRFNEELERELARVRRHGLRSAVLMVDLDQFKLVNDSHGHHAGDDVLRAVARTLERRLRANDCVARVGGDEFGVIAVEVTDDEAAIKLATDLVETIRVEPIVVGGETLVVTASIGVAILEPEPGASADDVFVAADGAMYAAKRQGGDQVAAR
jgi:diguanylate cyclase (GGDEF)-like protein/PAS domain S-box-containing protein